MDLTLPPNLERIIQEKIETGRFQTPREVVEVALHLLEERDDLEQRRLVELRGEIQEGIDAIARGEYREYTDWQELAAEIKSEGRKQLAQQARAAG